MVAIPAKYLDLLQGKATFAHLATIQPDGTPQVTPVWFDYANGKFRMNSAKGRAKSRNMTEGAPMAMSIIDPKNPFRYIQIRGRVRHVTEEGATRISIPRQEIPRQGQVPLGFTRPSQDDFRNRARRRPGQGDRGLSWRVSDRIVRTREGCEDLERRALCEPRGSAKLILPPRLMLSNKHPPRT